MTLVGMEKLLDLMLEVGHKIMIAAGFVIHAMVIQGQTKALGGSTLGGQSAAMICHHHEESLRQSSEADQVMYDSMAWKQSMQLPAHQCNVSRHHDVEKIILFDVAQIDIGKT